jgi:hypothetical protein
MSEPYRIRLRGPWEVRPHVAGFPAGRMTIPGTLRAGGWAGYAGPVTFYRRFGRPSNLRTTDRIRLAFVGVTGRAEVRVNGEVLGTIDGSGVIEVKEWLRERNELELIVESYGDECGITGEVAVEIVCSK